MIKFLVLIILMSIFEINLLGSSIYNYKKFNRPVNEVQIPFRNVHTSLAKGKQIKYSKRWVWHGAVTYFYPSGSTKIIVNYDLGFKVGEELIFNEFGKIVQKNYYELNESGKSVLKEQETYNNNHLAL
ncbi:MAG: hypothetical protein MK193_01970 [Lentisphaeria bacterium]|nr:hypothetical protein [Lentisphaeria bacterium]